MARGSNPASTAEMFGASHPVVLVVDHDAARQPTVRIAIEKSSAQPFWISSEPDLSRIQFSARCHLALVGLDGATLREEFRTVEFLAGRGFKVLSYAQGAQAWPMDVRCRALLAGAAQLLDSEAATFASELTLWITQQVRAEAARRQQEGWLKSLMAELGVVGESPTLRSLFERMVRVSALSDVPVLLTGETGTGKELFARALHRLDPKRNSGPFIALNCGAINAGVAESELFGHLRGSFTGADRTRKGLIRSADRGMLLLDEIGELDRGSQVKLLRVLQESRVLSVGQDEEVAVSVRIIGATNCDLEEMVQKKTFREDLYHRLKVVALHIPPLRERPADIPPLIDHFLRKHRGIAGKKLEARDDFVAALSRLRLPGNVRQLENLVRHALINKTNDSPLSLTDLPAEVWRNLSEEVPVSTGRVTESSWTDSHSRAAGADTVFAPLMELLTANGSNLSRSLEHCEKLLLELALARARGNQSQTARLLGITPRSVYNKLRKYHLHA